MSSLYICNTSSDYISRVNLNAFVEEERIYLKNDDNDRIGPHGICRYNDKLLIANNYSNSLSMLDYIGDKKVYNYFIGMHCNDVASVEDMAYVVCGESNSLVAFNLTIRKVTQVIPCESMPHSLDIDKENKLMVVANMYSDCITIFNCETMDQIKKIKVGAYPTKAVFSLDKNYIFICESNLGVDSRGSISVLSLRNFQIINRIAVGNSPVDLYCDEKFSLVSNFGDGTVSIIDNTHFKEVNKLIVGGMPRGVTKRGSDIYICDNYNNLLIHTNISLESKKVISIGREPTGMTLV